jgi:hypothetical protein
MEEIEIKGLRRRRSEVSYLLKCAAHDVSHDHEQAKVKARRESGWREVQKNGRLSREAPEEVAVHP